MINSKAKKIAIISLIIISIIISKKINSKTIQKISLEESKVSYISNENDKIQYVQSKEGKTVPIPKGYEISKIEEETSVDKGLVIYEGKVDWKNIQNLQQGTVQREKEILKIQSKYNQYVWVPVDEEKIDTIYGIDKTGKIWGKLYSYTRDGRESAYWKETNGKMTVSVSNKYFEPGLGYGANSDIVSEKILELKLNMSREKLTRELEQYYYETIRSIKKYGGFYIGRYETGIEDEKAVVHRMNENLSNQSWAEMYLKTKKMSGEKDWINSSLIWGSLMDYTFLWLVDTGAQSNQTIYNSISWGNYKNSTFEYYRNTEGNKSTKLKGSGNAKIIPSGSSEYTKANNIYDLAGNVNELTLSSYQYYFTYMGGDYNTEDATKTSCGSKSYQKIDNKAVFTGSRAMLLIK